MAFIDFMNREDVYKITIDTLNEHNYGRFKLTKESEIDVKFYSFPRLGVIINRKCLLKKDFYKHMKRNWYFPNNIFKQLLVNIYLFLVIHFPYLFADKTLFYEGDSVSDHHVIIPGNKKIKIIDYASNKAHNILKKSFSNKWLLNEMKFRSKHSNEIFIVPLEYNENTYSEEFLFGYSFVRLPFKKQYDLTKEVLKYSKQISNLKVEKTTSINYLKSKINIAKDYISLIGYIDKDDVKLINSLFDELSFLNDFKINVKMSHGDFQKGNLFYTLNNELYIIDWETFGLRNEYYDLITFFNNTRNSNNILTFIENVASEKSINIGDEYIYDDNKLSILKIFIIDDLLWQLEETSILPQSNLSTGLQNYIKFMNEIIDILKKESN